MKDLSEAQAAYDEAHTRFRMIVLEVPSGLPGPDGSMRVMQAGTDSRRALEKYGRAMKRYAEFTRQGIIPEDLGDLETSN